MSILSFATPCENVHILAIQFQPPKHGTQVAEIAYTLLKKRQVRIAYGYGQNTYQAICDGLANLEMETSPSRKDDDPAQGEPTDLDFDLPDGDDPFLIPPHDQAATTGA